MIYNENVYLFIIGSCIILMTFRFDFVEFRLIIITELIEYPFFR